MVVRNEERQIHSEVKDELKVKDGETTRVLMSSLLPPAPSFRCRSHAGTNKVAAGYVLAPGGPLRSLIAKVP